MSKEDDTLDTPNYKSIMEQIKLHQDAIARERDNLDDLISELEHLRDNCQTAYDNLWYARDALSELV
jgi:hypothetical protein